MAGKSLGMRKYNSSDDIDKEEEEESRSMSGEDGLKLLLHMNKLSIGHNINEYQKKKKFLLILDLNGLLIHRVHKAEKSKIPNNRRPDAIFANKMVFKRPLCKEFMRFCLEKFEVGIWSSAMEHNVDVVMDLVLGELKSKLLFIWNQKQCSDYGFKCVEKKEKPLFFKELKKVWESGHKQFKKGSFTVTNTLLLDDSPSKALLNPIIN